MVRKETIYRNVPGYTDGFRKSVFRLPTFLVLFQKTSNTIGLDDLIDLIVHPAFVAIHILEHFTSRTSQKGVIISTSQALPFAEVSELG